VAPFAAATASGSRCFLRPMTVDGYEQGLIRRVLPALGGAPICRSAAVTATAAPSCDVQNGWQPAPASQAWGQRRADFGAPAGQQKGSKRPKLDLCNHPRIRCESAQARMNRAIARQSSPIVVSAEQARHAGGHRSPKAPQIRPDIVGRWVIAPVHALLLLVLQTGNEPRVRDGYIGLSTRGHARARETRDKRRIAGTT
jgi:hypothetical protein